MSGNSYSPMSEEKMLAYIYEDVDDSDIFALESINNSSTEIDAKNEQNIDPINVKTTEVLEENEKLKEMMKKLQIEKDQLELRISEIYKTARTELERKERRLQELNEEKNSILFRRNRAFRNKQGNNGSNKDTELTNVYSQKFDARNKISRKPNLDSDESFQVSKKTEVLTNFNEVVKLPNAKELLKKEGQRFDDRIEIPKRTNLDNVDSFQVNKETEVVAKLNEAENSHSNKELLNDEFQRFDDRAKISKRTKLDKVESVQVNKETEVVPKLNEVSHNDKELTSEEFQRFDARYKIPKRSNLNNGESLPVNKETEVLTQLNEVESSHYNRFQNCSKNPQYIRDVKPDRHKAARSREKPDQRETDRDKLKFKPAGGEHRANSHQKHNAPNRRKSVCVDSDKETREVTKIVRQEVCNTPSRFRNRSEGRQKRPPRTPSGSPPRESQQRISRRRSRSLFNEKRSSSFNGRCQSEEHKEHEEGEVTFKSAVDIGSRQRRPPRTPSGSPPRESLQESRRSRSLSIEKDSSNVTGRRGRSRSKQESKRTTESDDKHHQSRKRTVSENIDLRSKEIKKQSDKGKLGQHTKTPSRSPSNLKRNSKETDYCSFNCIKDRKDHKQKQYRADNKPKDVGTSNSRRFRSQSCERGNRRHNIRSRSRSKEKNLKRSPERDRYRRDQRRIRNPRHTGRANKSTSSERELGRRNRYGNMIRPRYRDEKNRYRDIHPNINRPMRSRDGNSKPRDISKLREQILRYSMEKDVLKRNVDKRVLFKGNETDYSDLDDLRLHLSGASDEISSVEDNKERKDEYQESESDDGFELVKDLGPDVLKMSDIELERLLEGRKKELEDEQFDLGPEMSVENDVLTDVEGGQLTETEELEDLEKPMSMNLEYKQIDFQDSFAENRDFSKGNNRNEATVETNNTLTFEKCNAYRNDAESDKNWDQPGEKCTNEEMQDNANDDPQQNVNNTNNQFKTLFEARKHKKIIKKDLRNKIDSIMRSKQEQLAKKVDKLSIQSRSEGTNEQEKRQLPFTRPLIKNEANNKQISDNGTCKDNENALPKKSFGQPYSGLIEKVQEMNLSFGPPKNKKENVGKLQHFKVNTDNGVVLEEESSYRDPRQCSSSKDLREKCSEEKTLCDNKKKIDLDAYKKRKKIGDSVAQDISEESKNVNNESQVSKCTEHKQVVNSDNAKPIPEKQMDQCNDEIVKENNQIYVKSSENRDPSFGDTEGLTETNTQSQPAILCDTKNINSAPSKEEESSYNDQIPSNEEEDLLTYSPIATTKEEDDMDTNHYYKDKNSFLHDFSMSDDEDCFQNKSSPINANMIDDTAAQHKKEYKIKILDITIVKSNPLVLSAANERFETQNVSKDVLVESSCLKAQYNVQEASECIELIQEAVQSNNVEMEPSVHISPTEDCAVQKLDRDELQKCLEDDESEPKCEGRIQVESAKNTTPAKSTRKTKNDVKKSKSTTKCNQDRGQEIDVPENVATERDKYHERLMLCFGSMTPSPCKPPSPVDSRIPKWNVQQVQKVKRNITTEPASDNIMGGIINQNQRKIKAKRKTLRSKSADDTIFRNALRKQRELEEIPDEDQSKSYHSRETDHDTIEVNYLNFCNNPNYIPNPEVKKAFDSPNRYIHKKCTEYKEKHEIEAKNNLKEQENTIQEKKYEDKIQEKKNSKKSKQKPEKDFLQANKESTRKTNEVVEPEKKKRSKNKCIKIKMFPNQSKKRKGSNNSGGTKQGKKKKIEHSSSEEDKISFSDETNSETESIAKLENEKRPQKNKTSKSSTKKSKKNSKGKQSKDGESTVKNLQTAGSSFETSAEETTKPGNSTLETTPKTHRNGFKANEEVSESKQTITEKYSTQTETVTRKGSRIRKPVGHYPSIAAGSEATTKKKSPRRITPMKIGEVSDLSKSQLTIQNTQSIQSNKRKLIDTIEEGKPQKWQRRNDSEPFEKPDQSPLPHMEEMLKHLERKTSDSHEHPPCLEQLYAANPELQSYDVNAGATNVAAPNSTSPTKHDHSVPEITLDTKDVALLGTLERAIYDNMSKYLYDKSFLSLDVDKTKEDNCGTSNVGPVKETAAQLDFANCLSKNVNTSTPIKNPTRAQHLMKTATNVANSVSGTANASNVAKSYLTAPLKRDRRRRVGIVMINIT